MLLDLVVPVALYYVVRAAGAGIYLSLLVSAAAPTAVLLLRGARERHLDGPAAYVLSIMLLSTAASLLTGSTRFLLAKEGWVTGISAIWFLASLRFARPLTFTFTRPFLEGRARTPDESWDALWDRHWRFRRLWRVSTVMWSIGLLIDCVLRVVMAYTLPPDSVPGLGTGLYAVTSLILIAITNGYYFSAGLYNRRSRLYDAQV